MLTQLKLSAVHEKGFFHWSHCDKTSVLCPDGYTQITVCIDYSQSVYSASCLGAVCVGKFIPNRNKQKMQMRTALTSRSGCI